MQMRSFYEPLSRSKRAARLEKGAEELEAKGFRIFAQINRQMAAYLRGDPDWKLA